MVAATCAPPWPLDEDLAPDAATTATTDAELPSATAVVLFMLPSYSGFAAAVYTPGENFQICPPGCENFQITRHSWLILPYGSSSSSSSSSISGVSTPA